MKKKQHWLTEALLSQHENGSNYMEATYSIMFQYHGAMNSIMREEMTGKKRLQQVKELHEGLNEALEVYRNVKGL